MVSKFDRHLTTVFAVGVSESGTLAASGDAYGDVFVWDTVTGQEKYALKGSGGSAFTVAWSKDAKQVGWGTEFQGPLTRAFQLDQGKPALRFDSAAGWVKSERTQGSRTLVMSPDGSALLLKDGNREAGKIQPEPGDQLKCYGFTPDGRVVVGSDLYLAVQDPSGRNKPRILEGHQGSVLSLSISPDGRFLATGSADQTVRIWDLRPNGPNAPLLNIFTDSQGEWTAWTEPGYYAASPNGDDMIGWQVNRGPEKAAEFFSAYQFRKIFYRPDVIKLVLSAGSVAEALRLADASRPNKTDPQKTAENIEKIAPPPVQILFPADGSTVAMADIIVRAKVTEPNLKDVALRVAVNGGSRNLSIEPAAASPGEYSLKAHLMPGENTISVFSVNDSGESSPARIKVNYQAPSPERPDLYLFVVGVSKYSGRGITPLDYAAIDAESFAKLYRAQEGKLFGAVHARSLLDAQATRLSVQEGLEWIRTNAKPRDYVAVFVSGHGFVDKERYYFAPAGTNLDRLAETAIPWSEVLESVRRIPCRTLLAIDTCHSGGIAVEAMRDPYNSLLRQSKEAGLITLSACMPGELSWEDAKWGHGAFTFALLDALNGKAPVEEDGTISLIQVAAYVNKQVTKLTDKKQTSKLHADPNIPDNLPIAKVK
jgi:WD40 repeat protein